MEKYGAEKSVLLTGLTEELLKVKRQIQGIQLSSPGEKTASQNEALYRLSQEVNSITSKMDEIRAQ